MSRIVSLDTETTGLDPDTEDVFEIAIVDLSPPGELATSGVREFVYHLDPRPEVVAAMHPRAAEVNRFHERTSPGQEWSWHHVPLVLEFVRELLDGAHLVGAVPDFDTRHLTSLYRRHGQEPPRWHYHLIDVEAMAVGWLEGRAAEARYALADPDYVAQFPVANLPWRSDDLSRACGVDPPSEDERHTALGDARWVARWYRKLTEGAP